MSKFTFEARSSIHNGGSKYYQVIRITSEKNERSIVVTHWGKVHPGAPTEPKNHGQNKIEKISTTGRGIFSGHINNKLKRGYETWKSTHDLVFIDEIKFVGVVNKWFGRSDTDEILAWLGPGEEVEEPVVEKDFDDLHAPYAPEVFAIPASADKEEWGTW